MCGHEQEIFIASLRDEAQWKSLQKIKDNLATLIHAAPDQAGEVVEAAFARFNEQDRGMLALALGSFAQPFALQALIERLSSDPSDVVRGVSVASLISQGDPSALPALLAALHDPSEKVIFAACIAVQSFNAPEATPHLLALLDHAAWNIRLQAAITLLNTGVQDERILAALEALAEEPEAQAYEVNRAQIAQLNEECSEEIVAQDDRLIRQNSSMEEILAAARRLVHA